MNDHNAFPPAAPAPSDATPELIEAIRFWREYHQEIFATALESARIMYAFRPDLVAAPSWPSDVKAVFMKAGNDYDPDLEQYLDVGECCFAPDFEELVLRQARQTVQKQEAERLEKESQQREAESARSQMAVVRTPKGDGIADLIGLINHGVRYQRLLARIAASDLRAIKKDLRANRKTTAKRHR